MPLFSAAIAARHRITRRYNIKAGSVIALTAKDAAELALEACEKQFPPGIYEDHQANVQAVPREMFDALQRAAVGVSNDRASTP